MVNKLNRIAKDDYYLEIAKAVSLRSTCLRRNYGAVIVKDDAIVATGYNGSPRGEENCCDIGFCERTQLGIAHGEQYEKCRAGGCHAETNACLNAGRERTIGATLYLYGQDAITGLSLKAEPCLMCSRVIKNSGIVKVICSKEDVLGKWIAKTND